MVEYRHRNGSLHTGLYPATVTFNVCVAIKFIFLHIRFQWYFQKAIEWLNIKCASSER